LYFDLGSPSDNSNKNNKAGGSSSQGIHCENIVQQAKTVDYVAADGEYMASHAGRRIVTSGSRSNNGSAEKAQADTKTKQLNK